MEVIPFESADDALADDFCQWFVGLSDAVGEFSIQMKGNEVRFLFGLHLPNKNIQTLEYAKNNLKAGEIKAGQFRVTKVSDLEKLIVVFEEYPLRLEEKLHQFNIWREAFEAYGHCQSKDDAQRIVLDALQSLNGHQPQKQKTTSNQLSLFPD